MTDLANVGRTAIDLREKLGCPIVQLSEETTQPPERYEAASDIGKPFLRLLGIAEEDLQRECRLVMEDNGYIYDAYLWTACKYLWRMGDKDDVSLEIVKALDYLRWFRDRNYVSRLPGLPDGVRCDVGAAIAALEALQSMMASDNIAR